MVGRSDAIGSREQWEPVFQDVSEATANQKNVKVNAYKDCDIMPYHIEFVAK